MRATCAHSMRGPVPGRPETEDFCQVTAPLISVVVIFNGLRYEVLLCDEHRRAYDDAAAKRRKARKEARKHPAMASG